jgi:hypothetical protein
MQRLGETPASRWVRHPASGLEMALNKCTEQKQLKSNICTVYGQKPQSPVFEAPLRLLGVAPPDPRNKKERSSRRHRSARWGARRWARLRKYRAALLRGHPARVCCVYATRTRSLPPRTVHY